jgi:hypothetical protein
MTICFPQGAGGIHRRPRDPSAREVIWSRLALAGPLLTKLKRLRALYSAALARPNCLSCRG